MKPIRRQKKAIDQLYGTINKTVEIYNIKLSSLFFEDFTKKIKCANAEINIMTYSTIGDIKQVKKRVVD